AAEAHAHRAGLRARQHDRGQARLHRADVEREAVLDLVAQGCNDALLPAPRRELPGLPEYVQRLLHAGSAHRGLERGLLGGGRSDLGPRIEVWRPGDGVVVARLAERADDAEPQGDAVGVDVRRVAEADGEAVVRAAGED